MLSPVDRPLLTLMHLLPRRTFERITTSELQDVTRTLPRLGGGVPGLPDWECIPTPGHTLGHVVFFRRSDRVLIAGDAVLTAPLWGLLSRPQRISPPPWVSSADWRRTKDSVAVLARLEPRVLATGHGVPMAGARVADDLRAFADRFSRHSINHTSTLST
jgi:glyoxylase-like metal-dependent hydrolase (beta-lactamase superfamily II)